MSDEQELVIRVQMKDRWIPHFLGMLTTMENYGKVGASRKVAIYSDGDGDFHPKFEWDGEYELAKPVTDDDGDVVFDAG